MKPQYIGDLVKQGLPPQELTNRYDKWTNEETRDQAFGAGSSALFFLDENKLRPRNRFGRILWLDEQNREYVKGREKGEYDYRFSMAHSRKVNEQPLNAKIQPQEHPDKGDHLVLTPTHHNAKKTVLKLKVIEVYCKLHETYGCIVTDT